MFSKKQKKSYWQNFFAFFVLLFLAIVMFFLLIMNYWISSPFTASIINQADFFQIDDNITVEFSQPVVFWSKDNIKIYPDIEFLVSMSEDRKTMDIYPKNPLNYESKYDIFLNNFVGSSGLVLDDKNLIFYTEEEPGKIGDSVDDPIESQDYGEVSLSKDKYIPPETSVVKEDYSVDPYIKEGKYIDVSISYQVMTLFEDGVDINEFLVSTGKYGMPTPVGEFYVKSKEKNHWSSSYKLWMPYSMNFFGAYYIHELPYWPSGYREGEDHLGYQVSHGCIRLGVGPAEYVFNWADIGTPIYIHY